MGELDYRNPPVMASATILSASDLEETVDWGLRQNAIPEIQTFTKGQGIRIAVLDTGRPVHNDIGDLAFSHNMTNSPSDQDFQGHASHVCGTIRALANGKGVLGIAPEAELGTIKVLGDNGSGSNTWIARGIRKAIDEKVDILSMSLGGPYDPGIEQACLDAIQAGIFIICAAGNDGDIRGVDTVGYPARLNSTIAIAAYNEAGQIADFSSRGPEVDFAFPGENILSTWLNNKYRVLSGTSMATPFAGGTVALLLAYMRKTQPNEAPRNNTELRALLSKHAKDMGPTGEDSAWGFGIPDALGIVRSLLPPLAPIIPPTEDGWLQFGNLAIKYPAELGGRKGAFIAF